MKLQSTLAALLCGSSFAGQIGVETMLPETPVDLEGDRNVFATPFDYLDGHLFAVHVEPNTRSDGVGINLRTVVRHGQRQPDGVWLWNESVIEDRTIRDSWHTQASLALDREGYVHVAYNMHNMPWQYSVSEKPLAISRFIFKGEPISVEDISTVYFQNKTPFPRIGTAAIPGTQVTYPAFFKSPTGDLFITYRFALKPARNWEQRAFAGGIARYDTTSRKWSAIGGPVTVTSVDARLPEEKGIATQYPFSFENTYSVYLTTIGFDADGGMHVFWNWRPGGAGMDTIDPSYAYSPNGWDFYKSNGSAYKLPITLGDSDVIVKKNDAKPYYAPKSVAILPNGDPAVVIQPLTGGRQMFALERRKGVWRPPEETPNGASEIVTDKQGRLWAFATGLTVFVRQPNALNWEVVGSIGKNLCSPKVKYVSAESRFIVHAKTCDEHRVTIVSFRR